MIRRKEKRIQNWSEYKAKILMAKRPGAIKPVFWAEFIPRPIIMVLIKHLVVEAQFNFFVNLINLNVFLSLTCPPKYSKLQMKVEISTISGTNNFKNLS